MIRQLIILLAVPLAIPFAKEIPHQRDITLLLPNTMTRVHHEPNVEMMMTNFGFFGSQDGMFDDPEEPDDYINGFEFPTDSLVHHLFQGALWIGAEIDTINAQGDPIIDTIVTVGNDSWWSQVFEFMPPEAGPPTLWEEAVVSDEDIHAIYYDTTTSPQIISPDPNDNRPHIPLCLKIHQFSYGWESRGYDEFILVDLYIENIGARTLRNVWIGIFAEGDIYHDTENPYAPESGSQDDLCGFLQSGEHDIAWIIDNNGQPYNEYYDYRSARSAFAVKLVWSNETNLQTNFNWWMSNINPSLDWGPRIDGPGPEEPFPGGGMGTPGGDKAKYKVMSNGEIDYDQARAALPHPGWIAPPEYVNDMANGYDTRFLISFGPILQIPPGHVDTVTFAFIGGRNIHNDAINYDNNLLRHETDSVSVEQYYNGLNFSDLLAKADTLETFFSGNPTYLPIGSPRNFRVAGWSANHVSLIWSRRQNPSLNGYRLYRGFLPNVYDPQPLTPAGFLDTTFTDTTVSDNIRYYYAIASVDTAGRQGGLSREVSVNTGQPHAPTGLTALSGHNMRVPLEWNDNPEDDIAFYRIYRSEFLPYFDLVGTSTSSSYVDTFLFNGVTYRYYVKAVDDVGNLSDSSSTVAATPMGFNHGIMIINENMSSPTYNPDHDSMTAFYYRLAVEYNGTIFNRGPLSLSEIAPYSTVIWAQDLLRGMYDINYYTEIMSDYLDVGGNLLVVGPKQLVSPGFTGQLIFEPGMFIYRYLNLAGLEYPSPYEQQFVGGDNVMFGFPDFFLDESRVNRIIYPDTMESSRLFGIGILLPRDSNEVIYNYVAARPESTSLDERPIGIIHDGGAYKTAVLEAPLYFMREQNSHHVLEHILTFFGEPVGIADDIPHLPEKTTLLQNYPNPFNAQTRIEFYLAKPGEAELSIYNIMGQRVALLADIFYSTGWHSVTWDAAGLGSGIYFARLETAEGVWSKNMVMVK